MSLAVYRADSRYKEVVNIIFSSLTKKATSLLLQKGETKSSRVGSDSSWGSCGCRNKLSSKHQLHNLSLCTAASLAFRDLHIGKASPIINLYIAGRYLRWCLLYLCQELAVIARVCI